MPLPLLALAGCVLGGVASFALPKLLDKTKKASTYQKKSKAIRVNRKKRSGLAGVISKTEAEAIHQQRVALSAAAVFAIGGITAIPAISWLGFPLLGYGIRYFLSEIWSRGISAILIDVFATILTLALGYYFLASILFAAIFTSSRLIAKGERDAQTDFNRIFGELSDTVWLLTEGVEIEVPLSSLNAQDIIVVHAGGMIPVDGKVVAGEGMVDQHLLTGEAQCVEKKVDDPVLTSTLLVSGSLQIMVEKQGSETVTGQIAQTLEHAAKFKTKVQSRGEHLIEQGAFYTLVASGISLPLLGVGKAVAITYSGFGYHMRMSAPLMVLNYLRLASRDGILVKDGSALELMNSVDIIVFDKTGTLTEEIPKLGRLICAEGFSEQQLLCYAASVEQHQQHPIALAIVCHAEQKGINLLGIENCEYAIGHGLQATLFTPEAGKGSEDQHKEVRIKVGSQRFIQSNNIVLPDEIASLQQEAGDKGNSVVYVSTDEDELIGAIELCPALRFDAKASVAALLASGKQVYIISGDQEKPTRYLAQSLGIDTYFSETLPQDKASHIEALQKKGHKVCFVGDGINDSVALQKADVSISLHGAATIAQDTADIILMTPNLSHIPALLKISGDLDKRMTVSERMNMASGTACVFGVVLLGMGTGGAITLFSGGLLLNLLNSILPLYVHPKRSKKGPQEHILGIEKAHPSDTK